MRKIIARAWKTSETCGECVRARVPTVRFGSKSNAWAEEVRVAVRRGQDDSREGCKEAGVSLWEMMSYVREHKMAAQYDLEDFKKDMETVRRRVGLGS